MVITMSDKEMDVHYESKSRWVKDMRTRMRVFNGQIFDNIFARHAKDIADMHYAYLTYNFNRLVEKALRDDSISPKEYSDFVEQYEENLQKLYHKKLKKTEQPEAI